MGCSAVAAVAVPALAVSVDISRISFPVPVAAVAVSVDASRISFPERTEDADAAVAKVGAALTLERTLISLARASLCI